MEIRPAGEEQRGARESAKEDETMRLVLGLLSFSVSVGYGQLIDCRNCRQDADGMVRCSSDCQGDLCYFIEYRYDGGADIFQDMGCVIGTQATTGCRLNQDGHTLCLCNSANCNTNVTAMTGPNAVEQLPSRVCDRREFDGIDESRRWLKPCASSFCVYESNQFSVANQSYTSEYTDCSEENEWDLFSVTDVILQWPGTCAVLSYLGHQERVLCFGDQVSVPDLVFPTNSNVIECYMDYYSPSFPYLRTGELCSGQMCFISSTAHGDVHRGCISFASGLPQATMPPGFYKSNTGREQWLCDRTRCNFDLNSAELSWPESEAVHRNISRLRQWNIFYILNHSDINNPLWFFLVSLLVFRIL